jgi:hypothetical protein
LGSEFAEFYATDSESKDAGERSMTCLLALKKCGSDELRAAGLAGTGFWQ